jgi:hypothetical protein
MAVSPQPQDNRRDQRVDASPPSLIEAINRGGAHLLPRFIKAEANLLRLPIFALQTKGLRTLDAIECHGTITRNGETHKFSLKAARNTDTLYPGPLARAAHLAFLSLATERGFPITNPICWGWRDLCRRMEIKYSGREVQHLKAAIESTALLGIKSQYAVYSKPTGKLISNRREALHLYERVAFIGSELPDGSTADANYLWLADWYLENLNAMFTAPLDYDLWRSLDRKSSIASRLYEFLLINFYSGTPLLRINYEKLAQFLPVQPERYRSQAIQQFAPAFKLLGAAGVIEGAAWADSKNSIAQLHIHRGRLLTAPRDRDQLPLSFMEEEFTESVEVRELRNQKTPEWAIVTDWYRLWDGKETQRPTKGEIEFARELIEQYGREKAKGCIPHLVKRMKVEWPKAKTFGAARKYVADAVADYDRTNHRLERERQEQRARQEEEEKARRRTIEEAQAEAAWKPVWERLSDAERDEIRQAVLAQQSYMRRHPDKFSGLIERFCLEELARRRGAVAADPPLPEGRPA